MNLTKMEYDSVDSIHLAQGRDEWPFVSFCEHVIKTS
jgi:hypothetical protein